MSRQDSFPFDSPPAKMPALEKGAVHVWCAHLDPGPRILIHLRSLLSGSELIRAKSFRFETDRDRFIHSHGILRILLGNYLNTVPGDLRFQTAENGKPRLEPESMQFNISHSGDLALFAFSLDKKVGADIEEIHLVPEAREIIARLFSDREVEIFTKTPPSESQRVFMRLWTRGEALVKAIGHGFGENVGAISEDRLDVGGCGWEIKSLLPNSNYCGAVAMEEMPKSISCWKLPESPMFFS